MKIGFIGLGKLGLPVALSMENKGHTVCGYDINPQVKRYIEKRKIPYQERGTPELLKSTKIRILDSIEAVVKESKVLFVPIQTPHDALYEGITRLPGTRKDFDYSYLKNGIESISKAADNLKKDVIVVVISTVLPGTIEREIKPLLNKHIHLVYSPFFIAMGTTRYDFEHPEFSLVGVDDKEAAETVKNIYRSVHNQPIFETSIINAELIKVCYNTAITRKINLINTIAMICEKTGANVDAVSDALAMATDRVVSVKYMRAGMGDGGGCHPRDNIALSWLSRQLNLPYDMYEFEMLAREKHTEWFRDLLIREHLKTGLPIFILGKAFKKETNLIIGSPSVLLGELLKEMGVEPKYYDPQVDPDSIFPNKKAVYFIGCNQDNLKKIKFPRGSAVFDPWGIIQDQKDVDIHRIGRE